MGFHEPEPTNDDPFESEDNYESDSGSESETNVNIIPGMIEYIDDSESEYYSISPPAYEPLSDIDEMDM